MPHAPSDKPRQKRPQVTKPPPARTIGRHASTDAAPTTPKRRVVGGPLTGNEYVSTRYPRGHTYVVPGHEDHGRIGNTTDTRDQILALGAGPLELPAGKVNLPRGTPLRQQPPPQLIAPLFNPPAAGEQRPPEQVASGLLQIPTQGGLPSPHDIGHALASPIVGVVAPPLAGVSNALDLAQNPGLLTDPVGLVQHIGQRGAAATPPFSPEVGAIVDAISPSHPGAPQASAPVETLPSDVQARLAFDREMILDARRKLLDHVGKDPTAPENQGFQLPGAEVLPPREQQWLDRILTGGTVTTKTKPQTPGGGPRGGPRPQPTEKPRVVKRGYDPNRVAMGAVFLGQQGLLGLLDPNAKRALSGVLLHYAQDEPDTLRGMLPGFAQTNVLDPQTKAWLLALAHSYHIDVHPNENEAQLVLDVTTAMKGKPSYVSSLVSHIPGSVANVAIGTPAFIYSAGSAVQDLARGDTTSSEQLLKGVSDYYGRIFKDPLGQLRTDPAGTILAVAPGFKHVGDVGGRSLGLKRGPETIEGPPSDVIHQEPIDDVAPRIPGRRNNQKITRDRSGNIFTRPVQVAYDAASRGPKRTPEGDIASPRVARIANSRVVQKVAPNGAGFAHVRVGPGGLTYKGQPVLWNLRVQGPGKKLAAKRAASTEQTLASVFQRIIELEPDRQTTTLSMFNDALFRMEPTEALRFFETQFKHLSQDANRTRGINEPEGTFRNRRGYSAEALDQLAQQIDRYKGYVAQMDHLRSNPHDFEAYREFGVELERQLTNAEALLAHQLGWTRDTLLARRYRSRAIVNTTNLAGDIEEGLPARPGGGPFPGPTPEGGVPLTRDFQAERKPRPVAERPAVPENVAVPTPAEQQRAAGGSPELTSQEQAARLEVEQQQAEIAAKRPAASGEPAPKPKRKPAAKKPAAAKPKRVLPEEAPGRPAAAAPRKPVAPEPKPPATEKPREAPAAPEKPAQARQEPPKPESPPEPLRPQVKAAVEQVDRNRAKAATDEHAKLVAEHTARLKPRVDALEKLLADPRDVERAGEYLRTQHARVGGMHSSPTARRQVEQQLIDHGLSASDAYQLMKRGQRGRPAGHWASRIQDAAKRELANLKRMPERIATDELRRRADNERFKADRERAKAEAQRLTAEAKGNLPKGREALIDRYLEASETISRERGAGYGYTPEGKAARAAGEARIAEAGAVMKAIESELGVTGPEIEGLMQKRSATRVELPHGEAHLYQPRERFGEPDPAAVKTRDAVLAKLKARSAKPVKPNARVVSRVAKMKPATPPEKIVEHAFNALTDARIARENGHWAAEADIVDALAELLGSKPAAVRELLAGSERTPTEVEAVIGGKLKARTEATGAVVTVQRTREQLQKGETPTPQDRVAYVRATGRPTPRTLEQLGLQYPELKGGAPTPEEEAGWGDSFYPDHPHVPEGMDTMPDELLAAAQPLEDGRPSLWATAKNNPRYADVKWLTLDEAYRHALFNESKNPESPEMVALDNKRQLALARMRGQVLGVKPHELLDRKMDAKGRLRFSQKPVRPGEPNYIPFVPSKARDPDFAGVTSDQPITAAPSRLIGSRGRHFTGTSLARGDFVHEPEAVYGSIVQSYKIHHFTSLVRYTAAMQGVKAEPGTLFDPRRWVVLNIGEAAPRGLSKIAGGRIIKRHEEANAAFLKAIDDYEDRILDLERHDRQPDPATAEKVRLIYHQRNPYKPAMTRGGARYAEMPEGDFILLPRPVHRLLVREAQGSVIKLNSALRNWQNITRQWRTLTLYARPAWLVFNAIGNQGNVLLAGATAETLRAVGRASANFAFKGLGRPKRLRGADVPPGVTYQGFAAQHFPRLGRDGQVGHGDFGARHAIKRFFEARSMRDLIDPSQWPSAAGDTGRIYTTILRDVNVGIENAQRRTIARAELRRMAKRELGGDAKLWLRKVTGDWKRVNADIARHMEDLAYDPVAAEHVLGTVQDFLGNFSHGVPHPYADLVYPFWRWTSFITKLGFYTLPVHYPGRASLLATASNLGAQASAQQGQVPERLAGSLPIAGAATDRLVAKITSLWPLASISSYLWSQPGEAPGAEGILGGVNPGIKAAWQTFGGWQWPAGDLYNQQGDTLAGDWNPIDRLRGGVNAIERSVPLVSAFEGRGLAATNTIFDTAGQAAGVPGVREQRDPRSFARPNPLTGKQPTYSALLRFANYLGLPLEEVNYADYDRKNIQRLVASVSTELRTKYKREAMNLPVAQQLAWWKKHQIPGTALPYWQYLVTHPDKLAQIISHGQDN